MRANASYINSTKGTSSLMYIHRRMDLQFKFMYLIFTRMPSEKYRRRFRSLLLCSCDIFRALIDCFCLLILHKRLWPYSVQIVTCTGNSLSVALLVRPQQLERDSRTNCLRRNAHVSRYNGSFQHTFPLPSSMTSILHVES